VDKQLTAVLRNANEDTLIALANKGIYKRAVKDSENAAADFTEHETTVVVSLGGEKCVITVPLEESNCSCPSRTVCRHIITAILLLKKRLPDGQASDEDTVSPEPEKPAEIPETIKEKPVIAEQPDKPSEAELQKIRRSAEMCMGLICGVLTHGLVRIPETAAEDFELAAVRCHAVKMAECERLMRSLGGRIADCAARRASFNSRLFTRRLIGTAEHLEYIMKEDIVFDDLGTFRSAYKNIEGSLELLPVGQRTISGGEYTGEVYYFVNNDPDAEDRFLTFSDIRPSFYETGKKHRPEACPWGLSLPLRTVMKKRLTLFGAKVCEGRLSASKDTVVEANSPAGLDCPTIHRLMVTDFREVALRLAECTSDRETDRLFFIYPKRLVRYGFDENKQKLVMTFEDSRGCTVDCEVKYRIETKSFIEQLERICKVITSSSGRVYTLLVTAYIEEGRLHFFPIEVYDFIKPSDMHTFEFPQETELLAEDGAYAEEMERHISRVGDMLVNMVLTGMQTEHNCGALIADSRSLGMEGLAELISEMSAAADSCRHSVTDNSRTVLDRMRRLNRYIIAAEERIGIVSALSILEKNNTV
jgi:hypothetical protein